MSRLIAPGSLSRRWPKSYGDAGAGSVSCRVSAVGGGGWQARTKCPWPARCPPIPAALRQSDIATRQNQTKCPNRDRSRRTFHGRPWNPTGQLLLGCAQTNCSSDMQNGWYSRRCGFSDRRSKTSRPIIKIATRDVDMPGRRIDPKAGGRQTIRQTWVPDLIYLHRGFPSHSVFPRSYKLWISALLSARL